SDIFKRLEKINGWAVEEKSLVKEIIHKDFSAALAFLVKVGIEAEKLDHHPDLLIHSYNKVIVRISTHSEGGITEKDFILADKIEKI
ncbi:4a-hydroxytetrahydrobiopterin dehydratase, partial [Bacteroidota bacterium]